MSRKKSTLLDIAELRHRITFQNLSVSSDGMGGFTESWSDFATVWAKVEPVSGSERLFSEKLETQRSHKVKIRYRSDITTTMRFKFKNRVFQVKGIYSPDERRAYSFIDAEESQGT